MHCLIHDDINDCGIDQAQHALIDYAERRPSVLKIWLFGSRINGQATENSDLDIAIELDPKTKPQGYSYPENWKPENEIFTKEIQPLISFRFMSASFTLIATNQNYETPSQRAD